MRTERAPSDAPFTYDDLTQNFIRIALYNEYTVANGRFVAHQSLSHLRRWQGHVRVGMVFGESTPEAAIKADSAEVSAFKRRLANLTGLDMRTAPVSDANLLVLFLNEGEQQASARLAAELEAQIIAEGPDTVAAFIAEPVMGAGGVLVPPQGYFEAVGPVLEKYDIPLIADEVICGFGRTDEWFGSQTLGMKPTSISMAKQLTAGFAPLSAVAINQDMADVIEAHSGKLGTFGHDFTYGGHPVGCAVGLKTLGIYQQRDIVGHVKSLPPAFEAHLARLAEHPLVGALEMSPDKTAGGFSTIGKVGACMASELVERGVIVRAVVDSIVFCPQ